MVSPTKNVHYTAMFALQSHITKEASDFSKASFGAENETRTRDPNLGKVVLYQLSYFRSFR